VVLAALLLMVLVLAELVVLTVVVVAVGKVQSLLFGGIRNLMDRIPLHLRELFLSQPE
jgi:hypothetical protein